MHKESRVGIRSRLTRLWHLPDDISWMRPLPPAHRRGIILALLVMLLAFLWPAPSPRDSAPPPGTDAASKEMPLQADIYDPAAPAQQQPSPQKDEDRWQSYQIASGQTLAQLFRDNNLEVNDVFAMARVEGDDKPLSNLHSGQQVKIRKDANGVVTGLTVESDNGPVLFTRQADGSFLRAQ
ncbi:OapA family protein [Mixta gaviniae]|uniref:Opacity-associated protein A n=1 Tax=Mixta gaviniae TaxID=665914 RepID=A0A1X1E1K1_9GAMM|nr:LysM-like peptidoglycan-binding domain-containing protein [Mixta gaviniae]AUX94873.1 Opacity-associated protein A [Mixta gaviniae]ORM82810.1 Opacity-associated protein A [Mixta gaviniae]